MATTSTQDRIISAAVRNGWKVKARKGMYHDPVDPASMGYAKWDRDRFVRGSIVRRLTDGTDWGDTLADLAIQLADEVESRIGPDPRRRNP